MSEEGSVPLWAVTLRETVARIDERTTQIPGIVESLETLRRTTVPASEHELLMQRVDQLWERDLEGRQEWQEMVPRVRTLWDERGERAGERRGYRVVLIVLGLVVSVLSGVEALHVLGIGITVHP